jgi:hypothetical protein
LYEIDEDIGRKLDRAKRLYSEEVIKSHIGVLEGDLSPIDYIRQE